MEIINSHKITDRWMFYGIGLFIPAILSIIGGLFISTLICVIIFFCLGCPRFVTALRINGNQLEVEYVKFFLRRKVSYNIQDTVLEIRRYKDYPVKVILPGPTVISDWLHIIVNGEEVMNVDGRKGFTTTQFMSLLEAFSKAKAGCNTTIV
ncbi:hypothetical protein DVR12_03735 [Chitinophaga silvatica]|uniref:Uncharacterized protein n=1 Tax=Chitinophaga silvatica TaxID=2282649 RepID=A0A3E1YHS1_9BACT|nr:hypothetical protein [Chitinophaga silvatica]RFS26907.1 hypothetical protein DVR12_03735 [Chitinophaga silvatica]